MPQHPEEDAAPEHPVNEETRARLLRQFDAEQQRWNSLPPELQEEESIAYGLDLLRQEPNMKERMLLAAQMEPEHLEKLRERNPELVEPILEALARDPGTVERRERAWVRYIDQEIKKQGEGPSHPQR
jgi:hypothetical protein